MENISALLAVLTGLLLRFGIPIAITLLIIVVLRKVDARWQAEAAQIPPVVEVEKPHCWEVKNCPIEQMQSCPSPTSIIPCWQVRRQQNGYLREECLTCLVFRQAPVPAHTHS